MKKFYTTDKSGDTVEISADLARQLVASGKKQHTDFEIVDDADTTLTPLDTGRVAPAARDNTLVPLKPVKRQANLETIGNAKAASPDFQPTTGSMLFPRVSAASDVDTTQFAKPGLAQLAWAGLKDLGSLPGRTVAGAATGALSLADVPSGTDSWINRAGKTAAGEYARVSSAPTDLGNQGGVASILEGGLKDPLNALLPAGGAVASKLAEIPAVSRKLASLKPLVTGAAGTEDAGQAADKITHAAAQQELGRRAAEGTTQASSRIDVNMPQFDNGELGLLEGTEGSTAALEGYLSAANRGVASEIDPLAQKILGGAYTPKKFRPLTPDWIAQQLGNLRNVSDATSTASALPRRVAAGAINTALPVLDAGVRGGLPLAGYAGADALLSGDDREANLGSNLIAGTGLQLGGKLLKDWGTNSFPGASSAVSTKRGPSKTVRQTVQNNMDELIGRSALPTLTGNQYKAVAEGKLKDLGKKYGAAARQVLPSEVVDPSEVIALAKAKLADYAERGANVYHGPIKLAEPDYEGLMPTGAPKIERTLRPEIEKVLDDGLAAMQGSQHMFATETNLIPEGTKKAAAKQLRREYEQNLQAQLDNPSLPANKLLDLRTQWNSPLAYTDPTGSVMQGKKHAYEALHDAANEILAKQRVAGGRTYGDLLADQDLARQYALWSSFRDVLHSPRAGLQSRVSTSAPLIGPLLGNSAMDHYLTPSLKYYAGRVLKRAPGFGHALAQGLNDTTGAK